MDSTTKWIFVLSAFLGALYGFWLWSRPVRKKPVKESKDKKKLFKRHYATIDIHK